MSDLSIHAHVFEPSEQPSTSALLLLHGTGGDESDLLPLGRRVAPGRSLLSPRGNVDEHGALRFFRRLAEGVFDLKDLASRVADLSKWLTTAKKRYEIHTLDALGFSNGANTIAALLLTHGPAIRKAVLLRAMVTIPDPAKVDLSGVDILIVSGNRDPIIPADNAVRLAGQLKLAGATVRHEILQAGHELTQDDIKLATAFLK